MYPVGLFGRIGGPEPAGLERFSDDLGKTGDQFIVRYARPLFSYPTGLSRGSAN